MTKENEKKEEQSVAEPAPQKPIPQEEVSKPTIQPGSALAQENEAKASQVQIHLDAVDNGYIVRKFIKTTTGGISGKEVVSVDLEIAKYQLLHFVNQAIAEIKSISEFKVESK